MPFSYQLHFSHYDGRRIIGVLIVTLIVVILHDMYSVFAYLQQAPDLLGNSADKPCEMGTFISRGKIQKIPTGL